MADYSRDLFLECLDEWRRYPQGLDALPPEERDAFVRRQGYASPHDLLAHVAAWWEEADGIVRDRIEGRQRPARDYDLNDFNAQTLARFKETPEPDLLSWYEAQRRRIEATVSALTDEWLQVRTVYAWLDGVILEHLKEHGLGAPRFLLVDTLQREWSSSLQLFSTLTPQQRQAYLEKQGYPRFRDLLAHIIAWWETGIRLVGSGGDDEPCQDEDVDAFNAAAIARFANLDEAEVTGCYERTRLVLLNLIATTPDEILLKPNVQSWLRADVLDHYYEHRY